MIADVGDCCPFAIAFGRLLLNCCASLFVSADGKHTAEQAASTLTRRGVSRILQVSQQSFFTEAKGKRSAHEAIYGQRNGAREYLLLECFCRRSSKLLLMFSPLSYTLSRWDSHGDFSAARAWASAEITHRSTTKLCKISLTSSKATVHFVCFAKATAVRACAWLFRVPILSDISHSMEKIHC